MPDPLSAGRRPATAPLPMLSAARSLAPVVVLASGPGALGAAAAARADSLLAKKGFTKEGLAKQGWKISAKLTGTKYRPDEALNAAER